VVALKLSNDGYVNANQARHCIGRGDSDVKELVALLLDFRWTERQLAVNGIAWFRNEFAQGHNCPRLGQWYSDR
jgi:hypothetical protein